MHADAMQYTAASIMEVHMARTGRPAIQPSQTFKGQKFHRRSNTENDYFVRRVTVDGVSKTLYMHRVVWEHHRGPIPAGMHIHHKDRDRTNNRLRNLELADGAGHMSHHARANYSRDPERALRGIQSAQKAARAWHASPEGRQWHSEHAQRQQAARVPEDRVCALCNGIYSNIGSRYGRWCGQNCYKKHQRHLAKEPI